MYVILWINEETIYLRYKVAIFKMATILVKTNKKKH